MQTTDPIADMLTRLRNATHARHKVVTMPSSRMKEAIAAILKQEGFIQDYAVVQTGGPQPELRITLIGGRNQRPGITGVRRVSKPGLRVYTKYSTIPRVRNGLGTAILSTPKGVLSARQARRERVGGEVLCFVW